MTLIQRQDALVAQLVAIYAVYAQRGRRGMGGDLCGRRAKANRFFRESMIAAGYSKREAVEAQEQCNDMAWLEVNALA
jgi:hypothetical protein